MAKKLQRALEDQKRSTKQEVQQISGILGIPLNGQRRVEVAGRNSYVYVRLRSNQSEFIQAYNNQVSPAYNLPVLVERQGNRYVVSGVDTKRYDNNWNSQSAFIPRHGNTHSFDTESGGGGDIVWVYPRQIVPTLVMPSGSSGAGNVIVNPYTLRSSSGWKYVGNTGTANITQYNPTSPTGAIMALVYLDDVSGNPYFLINSGTVFSNSITGSSQIAPFIPAITNPATQIPLAAIRLITGTSVLSWDNIYDLRQFVHPISTGSSSGGALEIQDEGISQGNATVLNFVGANVQATVSGGVARIFITGSSGSGDTLWRAGDDTGAIEEIVGGNSAIGAYSLAQGNDNTVWGAYARAFGRSNSLALGSDYSSADGFLNGITGMYDYASGRNNGISSNYAAVLGGQDHVLSGNHSAIIGGFNNRLSGERSVMLGGQNSTGSVSDMAYVPRLNIQTLFTGTSVKNLGITSNGFVVEGTTGGGGGLTYATATITTSNVSADEEKHYDCTIAGLTANRDFNLPTPSAAGKMIGLRILDGDSTYSLLVKANGSEITRLFVVGEYLLLRSYGTGAGDWKIEIDGRVGCYVQQRASAQQSNVATATATKLTMGTNVSDDMSLNDLANNRIIIRRARKYRITGKVPWYANGNADPAAHAQVFKNGSALIDLFLPNSANEYITVVCQNELDLAAGDVLELYGTQYSGINRHIYYYAPDTSWASLTVEEM